jgi:TonB family protein
MNQEFRCALLLFLAAGPGVLAAEETRDPPPSSASQCRVNPVKLRSPDDYYPAAERSAGHSGRVVVEFAILKSPGKPVDLRVAESSSYPQLDAAGVRVMAASSFKTNCPGERFKIAVKFGQPRQVSAR